MLGRRQPQDPSTFVSKLHPALQQHKIHVNSVDQDSKTLKKIGIDIEQHLTDAQDIKDRLAKVEALREQLKAIKNQSAEVSEQMQKCAMKTGAASMPFVSLADMLEDDDQVDRVKLIAELKQELSSQANMQDSRVIVHLLKVVAQMNQHFGKTLAAFQSQGYDQSLVGKTNDLCKGLIRDTRHICQDQLQQTSVASDSVLKLSCTLLHEDKVAEAKDAAVMREMDGTQVLGDKVKNVFGSILPASRRISVGNARAKSTIDAIVQAEDDSERVAHTTLEAQKLLDRVQIAVNDQEVPLQMIDYLREMKRFFSLGSDLLNELVPDGDLDTIRKTLKMRRSVHAIHDAEAELQSKSSKESMRTASPALPLQDDYKVAELKFAPLPPPLPLKPKSLSPQMVMPPPPLSRPPSGKVGRPLSETPRFQPPSPPNSPTKQLSKLYKSDSISIRGLSLNQAAMVQLMASRDQEVLSYFYGGCLTPNSIKHLNTMVKALEETSILSTYLVDMLKLNNFEMFKTIKSQLTSGASVASIFGKVPQLSLPAQSAGDLKLLAVKQILANECKHFLQKVIGAIYSTVNTHVTADGDFGQVVSKCFKIIFCSRGLLPKVFKKSVLDYVQSYKGKLTTSKNSVCIEHMPVIVLLFYQLILPAMIAPEQFGVQGMPWDQFQTAAVALSSHRDDLRLASPIRSPAASVIVSEGQHSQVKDSMGQVAAILSELIKAQLHIDDHGHGSAEDIQYQLIALSLQKDFEVSLEDFVGHFTSQRADPFVSPQTQSDLSLLSRELDILYEESCYGSQWQQLVQDLTLKYEKLNQTSMYTAAMVMLNDCQTKQEPAVEEPRTRPISTVSSAPSSTYTRQKALSVVKNKFMRKVERWNQVSKNQEESDSD